MVVQHNLTAMNANRMLGITTGQQAKSSEKLSSGYRINRAADDAAGLSISEKMRKQIKGLTQASTNAQDGVSAVQTAEGALAEVHAMLQRMNELAVNASNGTMSESDRQATQDEISQLETEIDRVAETTKFNEIYLLKGDREGATTSKTVAAHDAGFAGKLVAGENGKSTFTMDALKEGDTIKIGGKDYNIVDSGDVNDYEMATGNALAAGNAGEKVIRNGETIVLGDGTNGTVDPTTVLLQAGDVHVAADGTEKTVVTKDFTPTAQSDIETAIKALAVGKTVKIGTDTYTVGTASSGTTLTADDIIAKLKHGDEVTVDTTKYTNIDSSAKKANELSVKEAYAKIAEELAKASSIGTDTAATAVNKGAGQFEITQGKVTVKDSLSFNLHVGADADTTNKIGVTIDAMSAAGLGIKGLDVKDTTGTSATYAIDAIADAMASVSAQRSALGAVQNRLEHTIANLDNVVENTTAAESRIRDTDMAKEMVEYSKNNILAQAGQSMLAQANQSTQGVLSLLQ